MISKKILLPALIGSAFFLGACGDDPAPSAPVNPTPSSAIPYPAVSSSSVYTPVPTSSTPAPTSSAPAPTPTPVAYPALGTSANLTEAVNDYALWKGFHFTTEEQEMATYPELATEFNVVFPAQYMPAGRVIWSSQSSGYYRDYCTATTAITNMKSRACTVSEGIGYGMLLAYFNADDDAFVRLWNYTRGYRQYSNTKFMPWITQSFYWTEVDNSSATDADEDIATALILMYFKSGNAAFLQDALTFINAIWDMEVNPTTLLIYSGDTDLWKGANPTYNLSYFSPVAMRLFAMVDPNPLHNWQGVLDAMYAYMLQVQAAGTGVFPDWSDATGNAVNPPNGAAGSGPGSWTWYTFNKESVRIPWRIAWDYYWYQDTRAATILTVLNNFIAAKSNNNPNDASLSVNYSWNLSVGADNTRNTVVSSQWYAAWCATGIASNPAWLNACTTGLNAKNPSNTSQSYFSDILLTMYSALLNGLFVRPF
jgi:endo-1,4-beta-D-glucanase Y